jgi:hypothetical protein
MWQKSNVSERRDNRPKVGFYQYLGRQARALVACSQQAARQRLADCQIVE